MLGVAMLAAGLLLVPLPASSASPRREPTFPDGRLDILTVGDSLTYGLNSDGESGCGGNGQSDAYRYYLAKDLVDVAGLPAVYQGGVQHGCHGNTWTQAQGGRTITNVRVDLPTYLDHPEPTNVVPDLVIVVIGVNDARGGSTGDQMLARYSALLDVGLNYSTRPNFLVAKLSRPVGAASKAVRDFNNGLPALAAAKGPRVRVVDLSSVGLYFDGLHWTDRSNERVAYLIYNALAPWYGDGDGFLPDAPCPYERC